ncbi:ABC transporter substrate-binding protein [Paenibacillus sp. NPDC056579]|uniref:ABC transporter substrate-binding protein n=1 Tax=unclassified Paenibacillus TaxID=185978 RepID=UPI001EF8792D|nr:extracellular solute-binding protein [Paenibacillus sp. H1-7]ULL14276.1 extracellular solute-binding protein [Paenibacillus sp. H1-7]
MYGKWTLIGSLLVTSLLAGCSNNKPATEAQAPSTAVNLNEPAEIVLFSNSGDSPESFDERFGNALRKKFPNWKITYFQKTKGQSLEELLAANTPIDIYWESVGQFVGGLLKYELQYDMTPLIQANKIDLSQFEPTTIDAMKMISNGKMYGLPVSNNNMALFYNKDIFDRLGVPYPKDGMTWDDVVELNKQLTRSDNGKQYLGFGMSNIHYFRLNSYSLPYVDPKTEKATISDPRWKTIYESAILRPAQLDAFKTSIETRKALPESDALFTKDQTLAMYGYQSYMFVQRDLSSMNWDMVAYPTFKDLPGVGSQSYPTYFSITNISKQKERAMEVIKYLISQEFQMELSKKGIMTVLNDKAVQNAFGQEGYAKDKNLKSVFYNKFAPISPKTLYDAEAEKAFRAPLVPMALNQKDINTGFREVEEGVVKAIADLKK